MDYRRITQIKNALKKEEILLIILRNQCNQGSLIEILRVFQGPPKNLLTNGVKFHKNIVISKSCPPGSRPISS
jgi:hypothetical protein